MYGLEVKDRMIACLSLCSQILRTVSTSHLTDLKSTMLEKIRAGFVDEMSTSNATGEGWTSIKSFLMDENVIQTANSTVFFAVALSRDERFLTAALQYQDDLLITTEVLRFLPSALASIAARILMRISRSTRVLVERLVPIIKDRPEACNSHSPRAKRPLDCAHWKEPRSPEKIVQVVLGLWFASVHQLAISLVYALNDLCEHEGYMEP